MKRVIAVLLLTGCATTIPSGPGGQPMHHVEGLGSTSAYKKASQMCPNGYNVIHSRQQGVFFVLDIECRFISAHASQ